MSPHQKRDLERRLSASGFSRKDSKFIVSSVSKFLLERDPLETRGAKPAAASKSNPDRSSADIVAALKSFTAIIREDTKAAAAELAKLEAQHAALTERLARGTR